MGDPPLVSQLPVDCQALPEESACPGIVALAAGQKAQGEERIGCALLVVRGSGEGQGFRQQGARCWRITSRPGHVPQKINRVGNPWLVFEFTVQRQTLLT